ncbi:MAG: V-type ATP synthase subunit I [Bacteroidaceae bacterium]|nr:V-type ATP synthase subunit I [Bacteroidaceae bacterium]
MISKMKKLTALIYHKEYKEFLVKLRSAGVLHVELRDNGVTESQQMQQLFTDYNRYLRLLKTLEMLAPESKSTASSSAGALDVVGRVDEMLATSEKMKQLLMVVEKDIATMEPWGDFDTAMLDKIKSEGYTITLFTSNVRLFDEAWIEKYNAVIINQVATHLYFVTVTPDGLLPDIDAEPVKIPEMSLGALKNEAERLRLEIKLVDEQLSSYANEKLPVIRAAVDELQHNIEFSRIELCGERVSDERLVLLQGWVPKEDRETLEGVLREEPVFYEISDPKPGDDVPVRFKNNAFFKLFEPICELYMLPKYNELDLTPFFAPFYMIFFGLCLGDMGYGMVISIASAILLMLMKKGNSMIGYARLALTLGLSTILCGSLTGTFFGFNIYEWNISFLDWWRDNVSFAYMNPETGKLNDPNDMLFNLSLILGGIQICYAMGIKIANQIIQLGFRYAVATIGWLIIILTTVAMVFIPAIPMAVIYVLYGAGAAGALLYNSPGKNIFLNIGLGLWDAYNMATGLLGDMLSYIRLFALGLSGGVLATVFNNIAVQMSPDIPVLGSVVMVIIFLFGHSLNIFMNTLGAFVHPIRLTFVEFFKNAGYEGGGTAYKPFK